MKLKNYLAKFKNLRTLYEEVKQSFLKKRLKHHNWNHVQRDLVRGIIIGEGEQANMKIVLAAILLHDIGRLYPKKGKNHYVIGAEIAPRYLKHAGFSKKEISEIKHCIQSHGPRGVEIPRTLSAKVCYDVDVLSCSVGYIGVARVFDYFMNEEEMNVKQMIKIPSSRKGPRRNFYTKTGRKLGSQGHKQAKKFWQQLAREFNKEEKIIKTVIKDYEGD